MMESTFDPRSAPSIRQRLMRVLAGVSALWILVVSLTVWLLVQHRVNHLADAGLQESGELLFGMMATIDAASLGRSLGTSLPAPAHEEKVTWQRVSAAGALTMRSHQAPTDPFFTRATPGLNNASGNWRVYGLLLPDQQSMLYVADRLSERRLAGFDAAWGLVAFTVLVGIAFVLGAGRLVRRELAPLLALSQAVLTYDPKKHPSTLPGVERQELAPIRRSVIDLSQRLMRRIDNERSFSAHAAHALRTPLAGMDAQLAVALRECPSEHQPRLLKVRKAATQLKRVVSTLLTLFRHGIEPKWQIFDLAQLLNRLIVEGLVVNVKSGQHVEADPDLLSAALMNLLDNAVRHGARQAWIEVESTPHTQRMTLTNDGPHVPLDRLLSIQQSLQVHRYDGHIGLGLMMADLVAQAHGGSVHIDNRPVGMAIEINLGRTPGN